MTLATFYEQFELLADAPNAVQKLREMVLQLAVRGKLVEREASDNSTATLIDNILEQKQKREGKIAGLSASKLKRGKALFEAPTHWQWLHLRDIGYSWGQKKPDEVFTYIDVSSIDKQRGVISEEVTVLEPHAAPSRARKLVKVGTVIYSTVRPYLLNIAVVDKAFDPEPIVSTAFAIVHPFEGIFNRFVYYYLRSKPFVEYVEAQMSGMAYPAINDAKFFNGVIPIPPTEEQKRIVAKLDELMVLCDDLETQQQARAEARSRLNAVALGRLSSATGEASFKQAWARVGSAFSTLYSTPETIADLRKTILQLAVQGKLVRQDPDDEPALLTLQRNGFPSESNTSTEYGSNVPSSWVYVRLKNIAEHRLGKMLDKQKNRGTSLPYLRNLNVQWQRFELSDVKEMPFEEAEVEELSLQSGDLLICEGGEPGRAAMWESQAKQMLFQKALHRVKPSPVLLNQLLLYMLLVDSMTGTLAKHFTGATIKHFTGKSLGSYLIALPPLAEQERIVAKVVKLMALVDELEAGLLQARGDSERLLGAVIQSLLSAENMQPLEV